MVGIELLSSELVGVEPLSSLEVVSVESLNMSIELLDDMIVIAFVFPEHSKWGVEPEPKLPRILWFWERKLIVDNPQK